MSKNFATWIQYGIPRVISTTKKCEINLMCHAMHIDKKRRANLDFNYEITSMQCF
jgi:hypothetical protein